MNVVPTSLILFSALFYSRLREMLDRAALDSFFNEVYCDIKSLFLIQADGARNFKM